jgi:hypothetical protein
MHEKMFNVASKHCKANLVSDRIPVKRQILSVHVYNKIPFMNGYAKRVRYESETIRLCVPRNILNHDVTS